MQELSQIFMKNKKICMEKFVNLQNKMMEDRIVLEAIMDETPSIMKLFINTFLKNSNLFVENLNQNELLTLLKQFMGLKELNPMN